MSKEEVGTNLLGKVHYVLEVNLAGSRGLELALEEVDQPTARLASRLINVEVLLYSAKNVPKLILIKLMIKENIAGIPIGRGDTGNGTLSRRNSRGIRTVRVEEGLLFLGHDRGGTQ